MRCGREDAGQGGEVQDSYLMARQEGVPRPHHATAPPALEREAYGAPRVSPSEWTTHRPLTGALVAMQARRWDFSCGRNPVVGLLALW